MLVCSRLVRACVGACAIAALVPACAPTTHPPARRCTSNADCPSGLACVDASCQEASDVDSGLARPGDAGPPPDGGPFARPLCPAYPFTAADCADEGVAAQLRIRDSDMDGLSDRAELCEHGTSPCERDSDGDGIDDVVEIAYGSDPHDASDSPRTRGDFVFVVPYSPPAEPPIDPSPTRDALSFGTDLQKVDVYVTIDTSGSMAGEMANLRSSFRTTIVPELAARIPDVWFGVGRFEDCPDRSCANGMNNMQDITPDVDAVQAALDTLTGTCGGSEPYYQTLWLLATGDTDRFDGVVRPRPRRCTDAATIGWPCFRPDAVRVVVQVGDEPMGSQSAGCNSRYPGRTHSEVVTVMTAAGVHYIGVDSSTNSTLQTEMRNMARDTGSVDGMTGEPIYFRIPSSGAGLGENLVDAIIQFTTNVPIRVDAIADDDPSDAVDAVAAFVERLETNTSGATVEGRICTPLDVGDDDGDGHGDHFPRVFPGTSVCFDIVPRPNQTVPATSEPQIFRARVRVVGDLSTPLDEREVLFLVPPVAIGPG